MRFTNILLSTFLVALSGQPGCANFWDSLPVVSQLKSLYQVISGDAEGARKTQENFVDTAIVVSQIKSIVQAASGDTAGALETHQKFNGVIEEVVDGIPIVGHIKGGLHIAVGETERGLDIIKGATSNTGTVIGGAVGGPGGAVLGRVATDAFISHIDTMANQESKPYGTVDLLLNHHEKSPGDVFDGVVGIAVDAGKAGYNSKKQGNSQAKVKRSTGVSDNLNFDFGMDPDVPVPNIHGLNNMGVNVDKPVFLETERRNTCLSPEFANRLEKIDFRDVGTKDNAVNCYYYYCIIAAFTNTSATDLVKQYGIMMEKLGALSIDYIINLFKKFGFSDTRLVFEGNAQGLRNFLDTNVLPGQFSSFVAVYVTNKGTNHAVPTKVWREQIGVARILITDFKVPVNHKGRFLTDLPANVKILYLLQM